VGHGPFDVVWVPGFVSNVDGYWELPSWAQTFERLASFCRLILWDKRGTGLSDPVERVPTLDERVDDLLAVMEASHSDQAALVGVSEGGPMALLFAATHPERVRSLVLYGTSPRASHAPDWEWGWTAEEIEGWLAELERRWGEDALIELFAPSQAGNEVARQLWGRYLRTGASPAMGRAVMEAAALIDCRAILSTITVPTLILHRRGDRVFRVEGARFMAERIPGAQLVELAGDDHLLSVGDPGPVLDEIELFLTGALPRTAVDRVLATVLFTDIVGSTARAAELGDRRWREVRERHDAVVRYELERFGGREVKTLGDGFLATFVGPSRAIACAKAVCGAVSSLGLGVRAGLHTGECEVSDDDVGGLAVHIASRVASLAGAGEVLVTATVKDLVVGSEFEFVKRGTHELRGVPGEWPLFSVET
jgi:pimeloyl-ACP methyl ester carboxylesterase